MSEPALKIETSPEPIRASEPESNDQAKALRRWGILIGAGVLSTTLSQTQVQLAKLPLQRLLKYDLHVSRTSMASFFFFAAFAWNLKPLAGILTDSVPLFGSRRRNYLVFSLVAAAACWLLAGTLPHSYRNLLSVAIGVNALLVFASTVVGGMMVEAGQRYGATGRLSSVRYVVTNICILTAGPAGGFLASRAFGLATTTAAVIAFAAVPITIIYLREPPYQKGDTGAAARAWVQLRALTRSGPLWAAAGLLFLVYISPGFSTPLYYLQTDTLHFSQQFIGYLGMAQGGVGLIGAVGYGLACKRVKLRPLLFASVILNAGATLGYLFYRSHSSALVIDGMNGLVGTLVELALMDLAARATPKGSEALGFALMMSVRNLSLMGSDVIGSRLIDQYHLRFSTLVWLNSSTTALILIAIPLLPKVLTHRSDGESAPS